MAATRTSPSLIFALALAACGGGAVAKPDLAVAPDVDLQAPAGDLAVAIPCVTKAQCGAQSVCAYAVADGCAATGYCMPSPTSGCGAITELCGCGGGLVQGGACLYPSGYASAPTTGKSAGDCDSDGGT